MYLYKNSTHNLNLNNVIIFFFFWSLTCSQDYTNKYTGSIYINVRSKLRMRTSVMDKIVLK